MEYVITTTILIEAPDERSAEDAIEQMVDSAGSVLGVMGHRNVSIEPSKAHRANIRMIGPNGRVQRQLSA